MRALRRFMAAACLWLPAALAAGADRPDLLWIVFDSPPLSFSSGPYQGQDLFSAFIRLYAEALPEYTHHTAPVSVARFHRLLGEADKNFCVPSMFKLPGQEQTRVFGTFNMVSAPIELLTTRDNLPRFPADRPVALAEVLQNTRLVLGIGKGRSYSTLDPLIEPILGAAHVVEVAAKTQETLFKMLLRGRIHYLLGLPHEAGYVGRVLDKRDAFVSLPIAEAPDFFKTYPSCTNNTWGAAIIERINAVNATADLRQSYLDYLDRWATPGAAERIKAEYLNALREADSARAGPPQP